MPLKAKLKLIHAPVNNSFYSLYCVFFFVNTQGLDLLIGLRIYHYRIMAIKWYNNDDDTNDIYSKYEYIKVCANETYMFFSVVTILHIYESIYHQCLNVYKIK